MQNNGDHQDKRLNNTQRRTREELNLQSLLGNVNPDIKEQCHTHRATGPADDVDVGNRTHVGRRKEEETYITVRRGQDKTR